MSDISRAGGPFPIDNNYSQSDDKSVTTVQVGENNLSAVAGRLGLDPQNLQKANPQLSDATVLKAGQEIKLPQNQGSQGPSETRDRDDGVRDMTPRPPSSASGDPLVKGFIQSKLDAAGKQTEFSAKDLRQASGGASAGRLPSTEYKPHGETPLYKESPVSFEKVAGGEPLEQVPSNYGKIKVSYDPQKDGTTGPADGGLKGGGNQGFDVLKLKPW